MMLTGNIADCLIVPYLQSVLISIGHKPTASAKILPKKAPKNSRVVFTVSNVGACSTDKSLSD